MSHKDAVFLYQFRLLLTGIDAVRHNGFRLTAEEADEDVKSILELLEKELGAILR